MNALFAIPSEFEERMTELRSDHRFSLLGPSARARGALLGVGLLAILFAAPRARASDDALRARTFAIEYDLTVNDIPDSAHALDIWVPLPQTTRNQTVHRLSIDGPRPMDVSREERFGNSILHFRVESLDRPVTVKVRVEATRLESAGYNERLNPAERSLDLSAEPLVPLDGPVRALAEETTRGLATDAEKARAIYEKVTGMMKYDKTGTGWGRGDALFACDAKRGNCTDFHALIIGMCRSVGIPARFAIGLPLPQARGKGTIPGYHCWAELYIEGRGWVPVDSSEASKNPEKRDYFFGHHDENRLEFSRGRNLTVSPAQQGPALNYFIYPYAEVDGKPHETIDRKLTFADIDRR
jgi:transglutaminase-like putative cysteine protease